MERAKRKPNRLREYDYSLPGYYFVTVCTKDKAKLFWRDSTSGALNAIGRMVQNRILEIPTHYPGVTVDQYVVMPNHIHMLIRINPASDGVIPVDLSTVIGQLKRKASQAAGESIWQKSFHDHIVRGEADYQKIWNYIEGNPSKWNEDCFFVE